MKIVVVLYLFITKKTIDYIRNKKFIYSINLHNSLKNLTIMISHICEKTVDNFIETINTICVTLFSFIIKQNNQNTNTNTNKNTKTNKYKNKHHYLISFTAACIKINIKLSIQAPKYQTIRTKKQSKVNNIGNSLTSACTQTKNTESQNSK